MEEMTPFLSCSKWKCTISFALVFLLIDHVQSFYDPCQGKGTIGRTCDYDSDCGGFAVVCKLGVCDCHSFYKVKNDSDGSRYCVKNPDVIDASCTDTCRFPMFCNNGKCQCIRAKAEGNRCYVTTNLGDSCSKHYECTLPFSACINGRCSCIPGTSQSNGACAAAKHCPDGGQPKGNCVRLTKDSSAIQNDLNSSTTDTCPGGFFCYTSDVSTAGHCCPELCPYGIQPDSSHSCTPGAQNPCPDDSHYCHRLSGQSFSSAVCCRRPCKEPNPVFINGKCYPRTWLGSVCSSDEQCQAGHGMRCVNGRCVCSQGFKPESTSFTSSENPPQQCVRDCGSTFNSRGGECFASVGLGQQCAVDDQCPANSRCYRGTCFCNCDQGYSKSGSACVKAPPTTAKPVASPQQQGGLLGLVGGLLKGQGLTG